MKYAIYARKSSESEDKQILSIDSQIKELNEIVTRNNLDIAEIFMEEKSAKKPGRQKFTLLMEKIEAGEIEGIITWKLDRLARNARDGGWVIQMVDDKKLLEIVTPTRIYHNESDDKFWMNLEFGMAKKYVDDLSTNTKRGLRFTLSQGRWIGPAPIGYLNVDTEGRIAGNRYDKTKQRMLDEIDRPLFRIEQDPITAPLIKKLFTKAAEPGNSIYTLAEYCTTIGLYSVKGKPLSPSQVAYILQNKFYIGEMIVKGIPHKGDYEPLINEHTYSQVRNLFSERTKPHNTIHSHNYKGLIKCAHCGCYITASTKSKFYKRTNRAAEYTYYHCTGKKGICGNKYITEINLEKEILESLKLIHLSEEQIQEGLRIIKDNHEQHLKTELYNRSLWNKELENIEKKISRLLDLRIDDVITEKEYISKKDELTKQKLQLKDKVGDSSQTSENWLERVEEFLHACNLAAFVFENGNEEEKRNLVISLGWNLFLKDGHLQWKYRKPYDSVTNLSIELNNSESEDTKNEIWLRGLDSNQQP